jgi:hypothetical protein
MRLVHPQAAVTEHLQRQTQHCRIWLAEWSTCMMELHMWVYCSEASQPLMCNATQQLVGPNSN